MDSKYNKSSGADMNISERTTDKNIDNPNYVDNKRKGVETSSPATDDVSMGGRELLLKTREFPFQAPKSILSSDLKKSIDAQNALIKEPVETDSQISTKTTALTVDSCDRTESTASNCDSELTTSLKNAKRRMLLNEFRQKLDNFRRRFSLCLTKNDSSVDDNVAPKPELRVPTDDEKDSDMEDIDLAVLFGNSSEIFEKYFTEKAGLERRVSPSFDDLLNALLNYEKALESSQNINDEEKKRKQESQTSIPKLVILTTRSLDKSSASSASEDDLKQTSMSGGVPTLKIISSKGESQGAETPPASSEEEHGKNVSDEGNLSGATDTEARKKSNLLAPIPFKRKSKRKKEKPQEDEEDVSDDANANTESKNVMPLKSILKRPEVKFSSPVSKDVYSGPSYDTNTSVSSNATVATTDDSDDWISSDLLKIKKPKGIPDEVSSLSETETSATKSSTSVDSSTNYNTSDGSSVAATLSDINEEGRETETSESDSLEKSILSDNS